jgi:ABC-type oligopeptide transport system substrate-binding subunit
MEMFTLRPWIARSAAALMLAGALAAAAPALAEKVLRFANMAEPETLDPHKTSTIPERNILINLFEGLVVQDPKGDVAPGVAKSWDVSTDGLTYTFHLRGNAKWSNGEPVTADDFVYSLRRIEDPKVNSQYAEVLYPIRNAEEVNTSKAELAALGVKALDPATVEITLKAPTPYFLLLLTHQTALPVNAKALAEFGAEWVRPGKMVSNGAYILADARPGAPIRMVKSPSYWDAGHVTIDTVVFDPSEDRANVLRRYRAGELDIADDLPIDQLDWLRKNMPRDLHIAPFSGVYYYAFNTTKPPFNDLRIRQALAMAVNREVLVEKITLAGELPAYGFVPDGTANYMSQKFAWAGMSQSAREAEAVKLMRAAGYGPGKPLKFQLSYNTSENHKKIAVALAAMWKKLGVEVDLVNSEFKVQVATLRQGDFQLGRAGWIADYNDAQNYLFLAETSTKQQNYSRFSNPDYDRLMAQASLTADPAARAKLLEQAETILLREVPVLPLYFYVSKSLVSPKISGWVDNPFDVHSMRDLKLAD